MTFGAEADEETSHQILDAYIAAGRQPHGHGRRVCNGASEEIIGRWLRGGPPRATRMVLATKGRFTRGGVPTTSAHSRRHLRRALDASLRRLGVEHIDLYQLHAWDAVTPLEETLRFLDDTVSSGKIGYYGFSNFLGWQVDQGGARGPAHGCAAPVTLQPQYSLLVREIESEIVPACLDAGIGLLPWSPLGGGWLTGKYERDSAPDGRHPSGREPRARHGGLGGPERARSARGDVIDAVAEIAAARGVSPAAGGPRLAGGPAGGHLGDPGRPHHRAARGQPRRRRSS